MKQLIYFADPMCSWCWGFSPQIDLITSWFGKRLPIQMVMGGLRVGTTEAMSDEMRTYVRGAWEGVAERTGQPFDFSFFERDGFVYDTEPACRAVVTIRELRPELTLKFFQNAQKAFYADGRDTTAKDTLVELAREVGVEPSLFLSSFESEEIRQKAGADFLSGIKTGVTGYPTLVAKSDEARHLVSAGYRDMSDQIPILEAWLNS